MKLMPFSIITIGLALAAVLVAVGLTRFYFPQTTEAGYYNSFADKLEAEGRKLPAMKKKVQESVAFRENLAQEWQDVVLVKTPEDDPRRGGIDLSVNRYQLVADSIRFRNNIQVAINRQIRMGGIKVITGPRVPDFPTDPATIAEAGYGITRYPFPIRIYDFGRVTVEGTRQQIERNVESWSNMPDYLAVVDGLSYEGTSPTLRGSYNLTVVMYLRGRQVYPPAPLTAAGGGGGAPGAGGGGLGTPTLGLPGGGEPRRGPTRPDE